GVAVVTSCFGLRGQYALCLAVARIPFIAPASGIGKALAILHHHVYEFPCPLNRCPLMLFRLKQVKNQHGTIGELSVAITFHRLSVRVDVMQSAIRLIGWAGWTN